MILPQKTEYLFDELKKELNLTLENAKKENMSENRELRNYVLTLHKEVSSGLSSIQKIKSQNSMSQIMATVTLELTAIKKSIEELSKENKKNRDLHGGNDFVYSRTAYH